MIHIGSVTEDEVVLAFVKAEIDSPIYGPTYQNKLAEMGISREHLINKADLSASLQNTYRKALLGHVRGYPRQRLFFNFPLNTTWQRVRLETNEISALMNGRFDNWVELTRGTRLITQGAAEIASGAAGQSTNKNIRIIAASVKEIVAQVRTGHSFPELIVVQGENGPLILLEGNTRATAYVLAKKSEPIEAFLGTSAQMVLWHWY